MKITLKHEDTKEELTLKAVRGKRVGKFIYILYATPKYVKEHFSRFPRSYLMLSAEPIEKKGFTGLYGSKRWGWCVRKYDGKTGQGV